MGESLEISCKKCDYSKKFKIGIGMIYCPENLVDFESEFALLPYLIKSKKTLAHIKYLLNNENAIVLNNYGHRIYHCNKCNEFYERFFIRLEYSGGSFEAKYKCNRCKKILEPINYNFSLGNEYEEKEGTLEKYLCPKCCNYSLYENNDMLILWD